MSAWILGSEMASSFGLPDFEFVKDYVFNSDFRAGLSVTFI